MPEVEGNVEEIRLEATVIRGSSGTYGPPGSREELGTVAHWKRGVGDIVGKVRRRRVPRIGRG